jgi:peroxiredoxin
MVFVIPHTGITVDLLTKPFHKSCLRDSVGRDVAEISTTIDFGDLLRSHKLAILIGVPGAFTPTCSQQHLPGYIDRITDLVETHGVEAVYCMSVNDMYVMQAWGDAILNCWDSGFIKLIADGNGEATNAIGMGYDESKSRMGSIRCKRFVAIIRNGQVDICNVDEDDLGNLHLHGVSVESILALL